MNRRVLIRNLSLAAAGGVVAGGLNWDRLDAADSYSVITDDPDAARSFLRSVGCDEGHGFSMSTRTIEPTRQDLAVVRGGCLIEPADLDGWEARLMKNLRSRSGLGSRLVTAERQRGYADGFVQFRVDGKLVDRIRLDKTYRDIEIEGVHGMTAFSLEEQRVTVKSSSCRHQLCRRCGDVGSGRIVCAPNRLVAVVSGGQPTYDAISG